VIEYRDLPKWIPGTLLQSSDGLDWSGVGFRRYEYGPRDVEVPAMSDFLVIEYLEGSTKLKRQAGAGWQKGECEPGDLTLLTRSRPSIWRWDNTVKVRHAYLSSDFIVRVADEVLGRPIASVDFADLLSVRNTDISACMAALHSEAQHRILGGRIFADSVGTQLAIHLLRGYAAIEYLDLRPSNGLSKQDLTKIEDCVRSQLQSPPSLDDLAELLGLGRWSLSQRFKASLGKSLPSYILEMKMTHAEQLVRRTALPLKSIAFEAGFSDQAHMTRAFRRSNLPSPASIRRSVLSN